MYEEGASGDAVTSRIYRDEPIPRTAALLAGATPPEYREMRKLARSYSIYENSEAIIFYKQGKFMEEFEDDFDFGGEFVRYFPTYQAMNDRQLRGYFSWRTRVRRGIVEKTSLSFAFVYLYELLNQIGTGTPEEGFRRLKSFHEAYGQIDSAINRYARLWLRDYVVYYNLDRSLLDGCPDAEADRAILTLMNYGSHSTDEVFTALVSLSPYRLENSVFFKQYPDDVKTVVAGVFASLSEYYGKKRRNSLCEKFFGKLQTGTSYNMFRSAVFFDRIRRREYVYEINDIYRYRCSGGGWSCDRFLRYKDKLRQIGALLKSIDALMRLQYGFKSALKEEKTTRLFQSIINAEIGKLLEAKRKSARSEITLDLSRLPRIREAALATQNRLLVEEPEEAAGPAVAPPSAPPPETGPAAAEEAALLPDAEYGFLGCLLDGGDWGTFARERNLLPSVLVDSINEKLFDRFGDTVIGYDAEKPEVIEDYREELRGMIRK